MKLLDPRLLRYARSTRAFLVVAVVVGGLTALLLVAQANLLADVITGTFQRGLDLQALGPALKLLALVIAGRAAVAFLADWAAYRASARAKSELRGELVTHAAQLGPYALASHSTGELATLATRGIEALDAYFSRYLPQLVLAVVIPLVVGLTILGQDPLAAVIIALTLPLIPIFMALIGWYTAGRVDRQWATLGLLSGHFLDVVAGLPTLAVFGRAKSQAQSLRKVGDQYRTATMKVLRISFLSSLVLELLATLSVALIAVSIGVRLVNGSMDLRVALVVLILAPEAYLPLRLVGVHFHAAAEGLGAAGRIFDVLEQEPAGRGTRIDVPNLAESRIRFDGVSVVLDADREPSLSDASFTIEPGEVTALIGPSGSGKSTVLALLMAFVSTQSGHVWIEPTGSGTRDELAEFEADRWRDGVTWVPQLPHLTGRTVREAVLIGRGASDQQVQHALELAGLEVTDASLPQGLETSISDGSGELSVGQRRRVALARALLAPHQLVLLDEPSAALDARSEAAVIDAIAGLRAAGHTVVVVAHRPAMVAIADRVVDLTPAVIT